MDGETERWKLKGGKEEFRKVSRVYRVIKKRDSVKGEN